MKLFYNYFEDGTEYPLKISNQKADKIIKVFKELYEEDDDPQGLLFLVMDKLNIPARWLRVESRKKIDEEIKKYLTT